jgi:hypothetical protein
MVKGIWTVVAMAAGLLLALTPAKAHAAAATVTFLSGDATRERVGQKDSLAEKSELLEGDIVRTAKSARIELTLADQSVVRLDGGSEFSLKSATLNGDEKKFTGKLSFGKVWAKVNSVLGGQSHFDVETQNAVAGVRGTTFRVDAKHDASALVRVYAGAVAVAGTRTPHAAHQGPGGERHEVAGPSEISKQQYEKLLASMMQVKISSNGELGEPEKFTEADDSKDSWVAFNQQRDGK